MHDDETPRLDVDEGGGELLERIWRRVGAVGGDGEHEVGVADGLLRPRRQLGIGEEDQIVVRALELIERGRRLGAVELDALGQQLGGAGTIQHQRIGVGGEHAGELVEKFLGDLRAAGANDGDGARARIVRRRLMRGGGRQPLRKRRGQRAPDARALRRYALELVAAEAQHETVAHGRYGGGARAAGEEGDLADRLFRADLGERVAATFQGDGKAAGYDDIERIGGIALAHEHIAPLQGARLQLGHQGGALVGAQLGEYAHGGQAGLGEKRMHRSRALKRRSAQHSSLCALLCWESAGLANEARTSIRGHGNSGRLAALLTRRSVIPKMG